MWGRCRLPPHHGVGEDAEGDPRAQGGHGGERHLLPQDDPLGGPRLAGEEGEDPALKDKKRGYLYVLKEAEAD